MTILVVWHLLSGFCLKHPMLCDCDIEEKGLLLLCISKLLRRETIVESFCSSMYGTQSEWGLKPYRGVSPQTSTRSRSAWTMAKVSTDVQAVFKRLLWIVTACGQHAGRAPSPKEESRVGACSWPTTTSRLRVKRRFLISFRRCPQLAVEWTTQEICGMRSQWPWNSPEPLGSSPDSIRGNQGNPTREPVLGRMRWLLRHSKRVR